MYIAYWVGGRHHQRTRWWSTRLPDEMAKILKKQLKKELAELSELSAEERVQQRILKFSSMGRFEQLPDSKLAKLTATADKK
ncbi:hypothetical protein MASR1M65_30060 [Saprospiraceae bacterium]